MNTIHGLEMGYVTSSIKSVEKTTILGRWSYLSVSDYQLGPAQYMYNCWPVNATKDHF
jgi:hypothetical protein